MARCFPLTLFGVLNGVVQGGGPLAGVVKEIFVRFELFFGVADAVLGMVRPLLDSGVTY